MLMVRLVLDLLARRAIGGPVPVLASMASWNPADQDLRGWLGAQLAIDYPALANPPSAGVQDPTQAAALLASGLILPVLDGLDEIPEEVRGPAISRINDALRSGEQLVVTCRSQQYRDAIRPRGGVEVTLRAAAAVQLRPLDGEAVRSYLCDDAGGPVARARWEPVFAVLGTEAPIGQALRTPLMVGLARAIYDPRPGELARTLRDPAELCSPALADRTAVESVLFDAFIPAAYRSDRAGRWKAQDAEEWLVFLARLLDRKIANPDLAWWQLPLAVPGFALWRAVVAGVVAGVTAGFAAGVGMGISFGLGSWMRELGDAPFNLSSAASPLIVLARDRRASIVIGTGTGTGVVAGAAIGIGAGVAARAVAGVAVGLALGVAAGVTAGSRRRRGRPTG
jgi:hypothetical protein